MKAGDLLTQAASLVSGERNNTHGDKARNFQNIALLWNAYIAARPANAGKFTALDVGHMMALMKIARTQLGALNLDDYVDAAGYMACAAEIASLSSVTPNGKPPQ